MLAVTSSCLGMGCCNGSKARQAAYRDDNGWRDEVESPRGVEVNEFLDTVMPKGALEANGHNKVEEFFISPAASLCPQHLEAVQEGDEATTGGTKPVPTPRETSRELATRDVSRESRESFHTCVSHESALLRIKSTPLPQLQDDATSTGSPLSRQHHIQVKSVTCPLPATGQLSEPMGVSHSGSIGLVDGGPCVVGMPSLLSQNGGAGLKSQGLGGGRTSRSLGLSRISNLRRSSMRRGQSDSAVLTKKRNSSSGPTVNRKKGNPNMPSDYSWLCELLRMIIGNQAGGAGSMDRNNPQALKATPLFVVLGACPSSFAPMQAVLYSAVGDSSVEFWWTKPRKNAPESLERLTLDKWSKGPYKNDPGRSKGIYKPLADLFVHTSKKEDQLFKFGLERSIAGGSCTRAFIEDPRVAPPGRYYLYLVWQEEWTQNPLASSKFIKGKIAYQRDPEQGVAAVIFLREYCITNGKLELSDLEEHAGDLLPGVALKELGTLK